MSLHRNSCTNVHQGSMREPLFHPEIHSKYVLLTRIEWNLNSKLNALNESERPYRLLEISILSTLRRVFFSGNQYRKWLTR